MFFLPSPQGTDLSRPVQTAQQSCELLLKIIDSILDYSKLVISFSFLLHLTPRDRLEASALKLEPVPFLVEDVVADCVELLLPLVPPILGASIWY